MKQKILHISKILFIISVSILAVLFIGREVLKLPLNSDSSCMMLEAQDILSGNLFLKGWNLTGISFLTTDLPFFVIGVAIFGVGLKAFQLAVLLMYVFMVACALPLVLFKVKNKFLAFCVLLGIGLIPSTYALSNTFVHTAGFALSFLALFFASYYNDKPSKIKMAIFIIITALCVCGDRSSLAIYVLPLIIVCLLKGAERPLRLSIGIISGSALGVLIEKAYLFIGGAELNNLSRTTFSESQFIFDNVKTYVNYFLRIINAYFFDKELFSIKTGVFALKIVIVLFAIYVMFEAVKALILRTETDLAVSTLSIGFLIITLILLLTTMTSDVTSGRYICFLPLLISVVIARVLDILPLDIKLVKPAIFVLSLALAATNFIPHGSDYSPQNTYSELAEYLKKNNMTNGYAAFWDSTVVDGYSNGKVHISPIRMGEKSVEPRLWFCKNSWYKGGASFIVLRNKNATDEEQNYNYNGIFNTHLGVIEQVGRTYEKPLSLTSCIDTFGDPKEIKTFGIYDILIYDRIEFK